MKKLFCFLTILLSAFVFCACGTKNKNKINSFNLANPTKCIVTNSATNPSRKFKLELSMDADSVSMKIIQPENLKNFEINSQKGEQTISIGNGTEKSRKEPLPKNSLFCSVIKALDFTREFSKFKREDDEGNEAKFKANDEELGTVEVTTDDKGNLKQINAPKKKIEIQFYNFDSEGNDVTARETRTNTEINTSADVSRENGNLSNSESEVSSTENGSRSDPEKNVPAPGNNNQTDENKKPETKRNETPTEERSPGTGRTNQQ
ncbi:MAG: hypothetical protein LBP36_04500 [Oscillospiraceae bacterium]|nr:hypothetical protein [Oscillospiraceae bacterium]